MTVTVLHAADLHLGAPLDSLGSIMAVEKSAFLRTRADRAFGNLVQVAMDERVDVIVLAGDVYDDANREVRAQVRLAKGLRELDEAGIRVFIAHGNHDPPAASYRPAAALPANVTVFGPGDVQVHLVQSSGGGEVAVAGVSFSTAHERANLVQRFAVIDAAGVPCVGVLHANVEGTIGHDPYAPCSVEDLRAAPVAYWALGHIHLRTVMPLAAGRWWAYPGNLQGRSAKPAECGPKGALVVPMTELGVGEPRFVACDAIRFVRADVDVSAAHDIAEVLELIETRAAHEVESAESRPVLLRLRLSGASAAHDTLVEERVKLLELVREHGGAVLGDGEFLRVEVATRPAVERSQLVARRDLLAALLERLDAQRATSDDEIAAVVAASVGSLDSATKAILTSAARSDPLLYRRLLDEIEQLFIEQLVERS